MPHITFEAILPSDSPEVIALARKIWLAHYPGIITLEQIEYMLPKMYTPEIIIEELREEIAWVKILAGGELAGFASYGAHSDRQLKLHKLYLDERFHGQGIGRAALNHVAQQARDMGYVEVVLNVNKQNAKAIRAYLQTGFNIVEEKVVDIGGGFVMDDFVMVKSV